MISYFNLKINKNLKYNYIGNLQKIFLGILFSKIICMRHLFFFFLVKKMSSFFDKSMRYLVYFCNTKHISKTCI